MSLQNQEILANRGQIVNSIRLTHQTPNKKPADTSKTEGNEEESAKIAGFVYKSQAFPQNVSNFQAFYAGSKEMRDFSTKSNEIAYESKPVRTVSYVQVPIYEKVEETSAKIEQNPMEMPCYRDFLRLHLLLREKDNELHVWRAKAEEISRESPAEVKEKPEKLVETRENQGDYQALVAENLLLKRELEASQGKLEEMARKLSVFQGKLEENEDLLHFEREKVKKAGVPRNEAENYGNSGVFKEMEAKIELFRRETQEKDLIIERISREKAEIQRNFAEIVEKNRVLQQQRANFEAENARLLQENKEFRELKLMLSALKGEFQRILQGKRGENQEKVDGLMLLLRRCEEVEAISGRTLRNL